MAQNGTDEPAMDIRDNPDERRWEVRENNDVIAYAEYLSAPGRMIFTHTLVEPEYEGRGMGSRLARAVLDDAVERGLRITPRCPFIRTYAKRHQEYDASVDLPDKG